MNMGTTLAVYAARCKHTQRPFIFPGSAMQWNGLTDMTDARLLARQLEWAATAEASGQWQTIAEQFKLAERDVNNLASWWHTDADLGRPMEVLTDMSKSRKAGFLDFQATDDAFFEFFAQLEAERIIPPR